MSRKVSAQLDVFYGWYDMTLNLSFEADSLSYIESIHKQCRLGVGRVCLSKGLEYDLPRVII